MKRPPARMQHMPRARYGFDEYRVIAWEFFRSMFNYHYTEFVITDYSRLTDYSYICIEGYEHAYNSYEEACIAADRLLALKIKQYYNIYLESVDIPLYTLFDQIKDQRTLH